jgi:subtilisin-like proprotein convertase family protein
MHTSSHLAAPRGRRVSATSALVGLAATLTVVLTPLPASADTQAGTNSAAISVPAGGTGAPDHSAGSVYPSPVTISGLTGVTTKVTVRLNNVTHSNIRDAEVLLVGPGGQSVVVMSDVGGNETVSNVSPTFDDTAATAAPDSGLGSGTYKPTNLSNGFTGDVWPAPAPASPYGTTFAAFNGTNPNGTWNLYVADDASGDAGTIAGGWTLSVETGAATFPGQLQLGNVEYRGSEGGGVATVTVSRVNGDDGAVGVTFATGTGTATAGVDYTPVSTTLSFADGQTSRTVSVPITDDMLSEGIDELVPISLSSPTGGATLGAPTSGQLRLQDNDARANAFPITIPASGFTVGAADPYPSNIVVAGASGVVTDVDVTLTDVSHTHIRDLDVLLVAPNGATTLLLQDVGPSTPVNDLHLTFSDEAAAGISQTTLSTGTWRPSQFDDALADSFPWPAPAGPWGTTLGVLDGTSPNGTWSLYVVDDAGGDIGDIGGGWSLTLQTATASAGGPYTTPEGSGVTLTGSTTPSLVGASYEWDVDGDGQYDDATGANPTVSAATLASIGLGDGPDSSSLRVRVTSGSAVLTSSATTLTVFNVAPTATFSNDGPVALGSTATVSFTGRTDPSSADTTAGFRHSYDFDDDGDWEVGDGTYAGSSTSTSATVPTSILDEPGTYEVNGRIIDKDGGQTTYTTTITVDAPPNADPVADAGADQGVNWGDTVTLDGTGSSDPDDDSLGYSWVQTAGGTVVTMSGATTSQPTFTSPGGPDTLTFELTVTDGNGGTDTDTVSVVVNGIPPAHAGADQDVDTSDTVTLDGTGSSDPDGDSLGFGWVQTAGPAVTLAGANTSQPTFTAPAGPAALTFELTVDDGNGGTDTDTVTVTVNGAPAADAGDDQDVDAGDTVTVDGTGSSDPDDDPLTSAWTQTAGPAVTLTGATTSQPTFTAPTGPATLTFQLTVGDGRGGSDTDSVTVTVNGVPTADAGANQDADDGDVVTLDGSDSTDPDGDTLTYTWTQTAGPAVTLSGTTTSQPTFTAPVGPATLTFQLTVADGRGGTDTDAVTVTVNAPPVADAGDDQAVKAGDPVTLDGTGSSDPDDASVAYAWTQTAGPTVTLTGAATSQPTFTAPVTGGTLTFELTVTDEQDRSDTDTVDVVVDRDPTADAGADQDVNSGGTVTLDGTDSSDPDGDTVTYAWTQTGGTTVTLTGAGTSQPTFTAPAGPATLTFQLTVDDGRGGTATDSVTITVNGPPNAAAGPDQEVGTGDSVALDGTGSTDPDGDTLAYAWTQTAGPAVTLTGAATAQLGFTAPGTTATLTFQLTVDDGRGRTDTDSVTVSVGASGPPVIAVTTDHACLPDDVAEVGLTLTPAGPVVYRLTTDNASLLPVSRLRLIGTGDADPALRLEARPVATASGVARVTITATNAAGTVRLPIRVVVGTGGGDTLTGAALTDVLLGRGGADDLNGRGARDLLCGGTGNDELIGGAGDDVIHGEGGDDVLRGAAGDDVLVGGPGTDRLYGGPGVNQVTQREVRLGASDGRFVPLRATVGS